MKDIIGALAEYSAIIEGFAKEYTDDTTVETVRAEHSELDFMEDKEIVELLEHAKKIRRNGKMKKELRKLLETVVKGNNDLMQETIDAAKKILAGGYEGHQDDVECLDGINTGFELEKVLSQGSWYWQDVL